MVKGLFQGVMALGMLVFASRPFGGPLAPKFVPCGKQVIVQAGDTMLGIALRCRVSLQALEDANPGVIDDRITTGQALAIPQAESQTRYTPELRFQPACGMPGAQVELLATGLPPRQLVELRLGRRDGQLEALERLAVAPDGTLALPVEIPAQAAAGETWEAALLTLQGEPVFTLLSAPLQIVASQPAVQFSVSGGQALSLQLETQAGEPLGALPGAPACVEAGSRVRAGVSGLPARAAFEIELADMQQRIAYSQIVFSDSAGEASARLSLPESALPGETLSLRLSGEGVQVEQGLVVIPQQEPPVPDTIQVDKGLKFSRLALNYGWSQAALLAANPQLSDPDLIRNGEQLFLPGLNGEAAAVLSPRLAAPGEELLLEAHNLPPNTSVEFGFGLWRETVAMTGTATTDGKGRFAYSQIMPASAQQNQRWAVEIQYKENGETHTLISSPVVVALKQRQQPQLQQPPLGQAQPGQPLLHEQEPQAGPFVQVYPPDGAPGAVLEVVGGGFPRDVLLEVQLAGPAGELLVQRARSQINGTFAAEFVLPVDAQAGEVWTVSASTLEPYGEDEQIISAQAEGFVVK